MCLWLPPLLRLRPEGGLAEMPAIGNGERRGMALDAVGSTIVLWHQVLDRRFDNVGSSLLFADGRLNRFRSRSDYVRTLFQEAPEAPVMITVFLSDVHTLSAKAPLPAVNELEAQFAQSWVIIGTTPECPVISAIWLQNGNVIDGRKPCRHQSVFIELPVLIAIGAIPVTRVVVPFVREAHRDTVSGERPHFLDEPVVQLPSPLAREEGYDFVSSINELRSVPPS